VVTHLSSFSIQHPHFHPHPLNVRIDEITFPSASQGDRKVVFVTERCVLELRKQRLVLTELAKGMSSLAKDG